MCTVIGCSLLKITNTHSVVNVLSICTMQCIILVIYPHTCLTALFRDYPGEPVPERSNQIWILLKQETVSGSDISWAMCKSAPRSRQITTPAPHQSVFYRPDALPATQPTASKQSTEGLVIIAAKTDCKECGCYHEY